MQRLAAINMLLRMVDQTPLSTLTETNPDVENIVAALDEALSNINNIGWWYNTDYDVSHPIDSNGFIHLADNLRKLKFADGLVQRGNRMYDSLNNSYLFAEAKIATSQVTLLSWDDTHPSGREAAAYKAASDFAESETLSIDRVQAAQRGFARAFLDLKQENLEAVQANMHDSAAVQNSRRTIRSRQRFYGDPDH